MPTLQGYQIIDQTAFRVERVKKPKDLLRSDYGAGYADTAKVGPGQMSFVATAGVWPDNVSYGAISGSAWMAYYWTFLQARLDAGNQPFVILWRGGYYLVDMDDPETAVDCVRCDNFDLFVPAKIALNQRRASGVTENADGSLTGVVVP